MADATEPRKLTKVVFRTDDRRGIIAMEFVCEDGHSETVCFEKALVPALIAKLKRQYDRLNH